MGIWKSKKEVKGTIKEQLQWLLCGFETSVWLELLINAIFVFLETLYSNDCVSPQYGFVLNIIEVYLCPWVAVCWAILFLLKEHSRHEAWCESY